VADELREVTASNVNEEVPVFRGSSAGELMSMGALFCLTITPAMTIFGLFIGKGMMLFSISLLFIFIAIFITATVMQRIRRGRPEGYFEHRMTLLRVALGWGSCSFARHDGRMDCYRSKQIIVVGGTRGRQYGRGVGDD